jgi:hypothetical protein
MCVYGKMEFGDDSVRVCITSRKVPGDYKERLEHTFFNCDSTLINRNRNIINKPALICVDLIKWNTEIFVFRWCYRVFVWSWRKQITK